MSKSTSHETNSIDLTQLVEQSIDDLTTSLESNGDYKTRYAIGYAARALNIIEGSESAHAYADKTIAQTDLRPGDAFGVWKDLYKDGDQNALPKARRMAGLGGEDVTFLEELGVIELGGLHSAERLVALVEAGDKETTDLARGITKNVYVTDRTALFAKLYKTGDAQSLDLAIEAAKEAKKYTEETGDRHYHRSEAALSEMAQAATENGDIDDALKLVDELLEASSKVRVHVSLFKNGREASLQYILDYLDDPKNKYAAEYIQRDLARAGYQPAIDAVKYRVESESQYVDSTLDDLETLHAVGYDTTGSIAEIIKEVPRPMSYAHRLGRVGLLQEELNTLKAVHEADPTTFADEEILYLEFDKERWQRVFSNHLENLDTDHAGSTILLLAKQIKALRSNE